jgi:predicted outer membrane repeat protein
VDADGIEQNRFINWHYVTTAPNLTFSNCQFSDCHSTTSGGAIYCQEPQTKMKILSSTFSKCRCLGSGGAIFVKITHLILRQNCFQLCRAGRETGNDASTVYSATETGSSLCYISAVRCPRYGDTSFCGIISLRHGVLNSENINVSFSDTDFLTGLSHFRPDPDCSFVRYYMSYSQIRGNAIGFVDFRFGGSHQFGAIVNHSTSSGIVMCQNGNATLQNFYFLNSSGPLTHSPHKNGEVTFLDCVFSRPQADLGVGFHRATNCQWNALEATPVQMKLLNTAFCEGNWDPNDEGRLWSILGRSWIEIAVSIVPFLVVACAVRIYRERARRATLPRVCK